MSHLFYLPLALPFFALLVGVAVFLVVCIQIGILRYAYARIGLDAWTAFLVLFGSLIGSYFNIPVAFWPGSLEPASEIVSFYGVPLRGAAAS